MDLFVRLDRSSYSDAGWAVPALGLPGARSKRLLVDDHVADLENDWVFEGGFLRRRDRKYAPSTDAQLLVELAKPLVTVWVPVIASVAAALVGAGATIAVGYRMPLKDPDIYHVNNYRPVDVARPLGTGASTAGASDSGAIPDTVNVWTTFQAPFERLIPPNAKKFAFVGQNLASLLGDVDRFRKPLRDRLLRTDEKGQPQVTEVWLVLQSPIALAAADPNAAYELSSKSAAEIRELSHFLADVPDLGARVRLLFHPASTLSMLISDWDNPAERVAYITPKIQTTHNIDSRLTLKVQGHLFEVATNGFEWFLNDARKSLVDPDPDPLPQAPHAVSLPDAPAYLDKVLKTLKTDFPKLWLAIGQQRKIP